MLWENLLGNEIKIDSFTGAYLVTDFPANLNGLGEGKENYCFILATKALMGIMEGMLWWIEFPFIVTGTAPFVCGRMQSGNFRKILEGFDQDPVVVA